MTQKINLTHDVTYLCKSCGEWAYDVTFHCNLSDEWDEVDVPAFIPVCDEQSDDKDDEINTKNNCDVVNDDSGSKEEEENLSN